MWKNYGKGMRGLSPIFAELMLISIVVGAGITFYMYSSGYLATLMGVGSAGLDKIGIATVTVSVDRLTVTTWAKSLRGAVTITDVVLFSNGKVVAVRTLASSVSLPADGTLTQVPCTFTTALISDNMYTVVLVSQEGSQFAEAFRA